MPKMVRMILFNRFLFNLCFLCILLTGCQSGLDLILGDPAFIDDTISAALKGAVFRIDPDDYPNIRLLFKDSDPRARRAGILIAGQTNVTLFYPELFEAALDNDQEVATEAILMIQKKTVTFLAFLEPFMQNNNPVLRQKSIQLLAKIGNENHIAQLITHFNDPDENVRKEASRTIYALADRNNPLLRDALESIDPMTAAMAYQTLGRYANPLDAPVFIAAFTSPHTIVQTEAQLAILKLGESGLEFLHETISNREKPLQQRLGALNVIQGIRSIRSIIPLFLLLNDENKGIYTKVKGILGTYGKEAIPVLNEIYLESDPPQRIYAIQIMGKMGGREALLSIAGALEDPSSDVRLEAENLLKGFGEDAWAILHNVIISSKDNIKITAMNILRSGGDPWLVQKNNNEINVNGLFTLIRASQKEEIAQYLEMIQINRIAKESILSLKTSRTLAEKFSSLRSDFRSDSNPYLNAWQQRELYAVSARSMRRKSFDLLHEYIKNQDTESLELSKNMRIQSQIMEEKIHLQTKIMKSVPEASREEGKESLLLYKEIQNELLRIWKYIEPEMKVIARKIFDEYNLIPEDFHNQSTILDE